MSGSSGPSSAASSANTSEPPKSPGQDWRPSYGTPHGPYAAFVIDRQWDVVARNESTAVLLEGIAPELLIPPVNALRLALHPSGLAPRIVNLAEWSSCLLRRLDHQILAGADAGLAKLADEARAATWE